MSWYWVRFEYEGETHRYGNDRWLERAMCYAEGCHQQYGNAVVREAADWRDEAEGKIVYVAKGSQEAYDVAKAMLTVRSNMAAMDRLKADMQTVLDHLQRSSDVQD